MLHWLRVIGIVVVGLLASAFIFYVTVWQVIRGW